MILIHLIKSKDQRTPVNMHKSYDRLQTYIFRSAQSVFIRNYPRGGVIYALEIYVVSMMTLTVCLY